MDEKRLLIIEDDPGLASQMRWCFEGVQVSVAADAEEAQALLHSHEPHVVTLDLGLPPDPGGVSIGFDLLRTIGTLLPRTKVILITGREEHQHAVKAVAEGAYDFYQKPVDGDTLRFVVDRAFRLWELEDENLRLSRALTKMPLDGLVTSATQMLDVVRQVERVAQTDAAVLIKGEPGTGKELVARGLHSVSARAGAPFVVVNCAAIPENLLERELFGEEQEVANAPAARTGGKVQAAEGGTLLLEEIDHLPLRLQGRILRLLQSGTVDPVDSTKVATVDVRLISTAHDDLRGLAERQLFRKDLLVLIAGVSLSVPPLRERGSDPVLIAKSFLQRYGEGRGLQLSKDAMSALENWGWPGNVRELEDRIKLACLETEGRFIMPKDLGLETESEQAPINLKEVRARAERDAIVRALNRSNDNVSQAARLLGISRPTLYNLFSKHGLVVEANSD